MQKYLDNLVNPIVARLSALNPKKQKEAVLGILGLSIFVVFGVSLLVLNSAKDRVGFLPETGIVTIVVGDAGDADDGGCDYASVNGLNCTLREAIKLANTNTSVDTVQIQISSAVNQINLNNTLPEITRSSAPIEIIGRENPNDLVINMNRVN